MKFNILVSFITCLFLSQLTFGQVKVRLSNGKDFVIKGDEVYSNTNSYGTVEKQFVEESVDTVYHYTYQTFEGGGFTLEYTRIPLQIFNKANAKKTGASMSFMDKKKYGNSCDMLSFQCSKELMAGKLAYFPSTKYDANGGSTVPSVCLKNISFLDKNKAQNLLKRLKMYAED